MLTSAILFAVFLGVAICAHQVADHVFQTDNMAANKAKPGRTGWSYLLQHVYVYHTIMLGMLLVTVVALGLTISVCGLLLAIGFSAMTHAVLDRRWPVKWILDHTGSPEFAKLQSPLCGMYLADQGLHYFCLWISALLFACV
jgi:hypothetical protein